MILENDRERQEGHVVFCQPASPSNLRNSFIEGTF